MAGFTNNRTNTTILFGKNKTYKYYYNRYNRFDKIKDRIDDVIWFAPNKGTGNEYIWALGCRGTTKPSLGCVKNLVLDGNGCKLYIPKNEFCGEGFADWATIQLNEDYLPKLLLLYINLLRRNRTIAHAYFYYRKWKNGLKKL